MDEEYSFKCEDCTAIDYLTECNECREDFIANMAMINDEISTQNELYSWGKI